MSELIKNVYRERVDFSKIPSVFPIPNLLEIQKQSYARFLQSGKEPADRDDIGLQSVFNSVFPITDFRGTSSLEFVDYSTLHYRPDDSLEYEVAYRSSTESSLRTTCCSTGSTSRR